MEGSRIMDLDCVVEEFSDSLQLCEPLSVSSCRSLVAPDILGTDVLAGAFNSISIIESSGQRDDEGKEKVEFDDASEIQCADTKCLSSPRRSVKVNQKRQTRKAARKCGKIVIKQPLFDSIRLTVARKRRSYLCKPARSSVWGSSGYITQLFVQNTGVDVNQNEITKSRKARGVQGNRKRIKSHSHTSKVEKAAPTGRIRLKITIGKEAGQSCLKNVVSVNNNSTRDNLETSIEVPKLSDCNENKLKEYLPGINGVRCCNPDPAKVVTVSEASQLNMVIAEKYLEIPMTCEKSAGVPVDAHQLGLSQIEIERSGVGGDNSYVDSGTSPDSEVINLIPETQLGGRSQEYFHDGLISSQACVTPGDFGSLNLPPTSSKKGKKKDKLPHVVNFIMEDRLPSPEIINNASELEKRSQGDKGGDGFYSSEASISTAVANASVSTSSCEGFPRGSLSSSRVTDCGLSAEEMKVVGGTEEDLRFGLDVRLESPESHDSKKVLLYSKTKGRKHLKKSKSGGLNNSCLELSDSPRSQRGNACRKKGNSGKSVSRRKVKDESACDGVICKVESFPEKGKHSLDDAGGTKAGDENSFMDIFNLDGKQHVLPRKAWVCCDDCFKWRRIAATLADSIEETNCRWTCKDSLDKEFSDCSIPQEKSNAEINVELQISDVSGEEDAYDTPLNPKRLELKHLTAHEQSSWMLVKSNLFLNRGRKTQTIDEIMVCHCKRHPVGRMGCGDGCLNRMLNIECVEGTCPCGELCSNQQFQKHHYAKLRWFRCGKKGYGLQSVEDISEGQFLIEYVGEVLDMHAYEMRQREYASMGHKHFYFMTLNGSEVIDACAKGNLGRFINHSCDPNCRTEKWMVNGEVCIGLFALRDIKKGEEVTFDYNYVRVFGAAAKKCVCGSSQCRGYLGGDPLNSEVIVQGDSDEEYPEPVMFCEDGDIDDNFKHWISPTSSLDATEIQTADNIFGNKKKRDKSATAVGYSTELKTAESLVKDEHEVDKSATAVQHLEIVSQISLNKSASDAPLRLSLEMTNSDDTLPLTVQRVEPSSQVDDASSKTIFDVEQGSVQRSETFAPFATTSKLLSDTIDDNKYMSNAMEEKRASKSHRRMKTSRSSASVKKEKLKSNTLVVNKPDMSVNKTNVLPYKPRKIMEGSLNGRFEAVEEKLNELLDADGGVSKRKDAPRGYLKLLFVTANGEAIQSNRDLSMILDALLKTKSRTVLVDIISKNGLQMLHNMMKRSRREFNKTPILRKLLKVLEYLAVREILTLEHINAGPPREGVESFRDSILTLTEHDDRQVHQIARNFRDRWIPRPAKKSCSIDRSDGRVEFHRGSNSHRYSAPQNHWQDQGVNTTEVVNCIKEPIVATNSAGAGNLEGCSASGASCCTASGLKTRKRKSRWDQPAEVNTDARSPQHKESKVEPSLLQKSCSDPQTDIGEVPLDHMNGINGGDRHGLVHNVSQQMEASGNDAVQNVDEDFPPGFLPVNPPSVLPNAPPTATDTQQENGIPAKFSCEVVMGHPHERFINRLAVSYGIPLPVVQQFGVPEAETLESWVVAPGVPFRPFPPLPPYPRDKRGAPPCAGYPLIKNEHAGKVEQGSLRYNICQSDQNTPSTSGTSPPDVAIQGANNQHNFQGAGGSNVLGRKYFRQQKWNHSGVGVAPPWNQKRNWHCEGNNFRNRMCNVGVATVANEIKGPNISPGVRTGVENACNTFCQYPQQQNYH